MKHVPAVMVREAEAGSMRETAGRQEGCRVRGSSVERWNMEQSPWGAEGPSYHAGTDGEKRGEMKVQLLL